MCCEFTPKLVELYKTLKEKGENFEVVLISLDDEEEDFKESFETMPWLALPFNDKSCEKLVRYFELSTIPNLVIIGQDGKTLNSNVAELIEEHGIEAYPFTPEKLDELAAIEKAKLESQTLESVLVIGENDFVIDKSGSKVIFLFYALLSITFISSLIEFISKGFFYHSSGLFLIRSQCLN
jgi:nucleoredoxin